MPKKEHLIAEHADWTQNLADLKAQAKPAKGAGRARKLEAVRQAEEWVTYYAAELRKHYNYEP